MSARLVLVIGSLFFQSRVIQNSDAKNMNFFQMKRKKSIEMQKYKAKVILIFFSIS